MKDPFSLFSKLLAVYKKHGEEHAEIKSRGCVCWSGICKTGGDLVNAHKNCLMLTLASWTHLLVNVPAMGGSLAS